MLKNIVIPTDGSKASLVSIEYSLNIAKLFGAKVTGLSVIDIRRLAGPFIHDIGTSIGGMVPYGSFMDTIKDMLNSAADTALLNLENMCKEKDVPFELKKEEGIITRLISEAAADADLIAMGKTGEHSEWSDALLGSNLESVVRQAHKPILITSEKHTPMTKLLVAYDGSDIAGKALKASAEIAGKMQLPGTVLCVGFGKEKIEELSSRAEQIFKPYSVDFKMSFENGEPENVVLNKFNEGGYDFMAMGAYGHSKIRELILGSTTVHIMRKVDAPLLICR